MFKFFLENYKIEVKNVYELKQTRVFTCIHFKLIVEEDIFSMYLYISKNEDRTYELSHLEHITSKKCPICHRYSILCVEFVTLDKKEKQKKLKSVYDELKDQLINYPNFRLRLLNL